MQVSLADRMIGSGNPALEDRKEVFRRVAMSIAAEAGILIGAVVYGVVIGKFLADLGIDKAFVRHQRTGAAGVGHDDRAHGLCGHIGHVEGLGATVALNERHNGFLWRRLFEGAVLGFAADVAFVGFDNLVCAAKAADSLMAVIGHGFANAMREKPSRAVGAEAEVSHELMRRNAFLAGRHQMNSEQPLMQRDVRALHNRASAAGEFVAAIVAQEHTGLRLAFHAADVERPAMRAVHIAVRPARGFDVRAGSVFVMEARGGKIGHG